jgi:hypothetical protein
MAALRIRWFRHICGNENLYQNWKITLQFWLKKEGITITNVLKLGFHDLQILTSKLQQRGLLFWASTFKQISYAAEIWEEQTDNFAMLPLFGGYLARKANKNRRATWLSFFNPKEPLMKSLFYKYPLVANLFHKKISTGQI